MTSSPVPYEIRTAVPNDLPRLIDLIADHADFERQKVNRAHLAENLPRYLFGADARLSVMVAGRGGKLVGYGAASYLAPQSRGAGLGARMLAAFENLARQQNLGWMEWQTPDWNIDAARFYERNGARALPKLRFAKTLSHIPSR